MKAVVGDDERKYKFLGKACHQCQGAQHEDCAFREAPVWAATLGCCCGALPPMDKGVAERRFMECTREKEDAEAAYQRFVFAAGVPAPLDMLSARSGVPEGINGVDTLSSKGALVI
jgi:hypothetical protein